MFSSVALVFALQILICRHIQLSNPQDLSEFEGLELYLRIAAVACVCIVFTLIGSPVLLILLVMYACGHKKSKKWLKSYAKIWLELKNPYLKQLVQDPLAFIFIPKAWRQNPWNWIDMGAFATTAIVIVKSFGPIPAEDLPMYRNVVSVAILALWIKFLAFMKSANLKFAAFVLMLRELVTALAPFLAVMIVILVMFVHVYYFRNSDEHSSKYEFHDDEITSPFYPLSTLAKSLTLLALVGQFDVAAYDKSVWDTSLLIIFCIIVNVVMINVLIAIVSDEYDRCMALAFELYWTEQLRQVTESSLVFPEAVTGLVAQTDPLTIKKVRALLRQEMVEGERAQEQSMSR